MSREAFKQRMQLLKSYREQNPGKGYWDWKIQSYEDGGTTGEPTIWDVFKHNANAVLSAVKRKISGNEVYDADVIDLTNKNMQRITPSTSNVNSILSNEFVEDNPNNIRKAQDFRNTTDTLIGDKKIPLSKISQFYGVESGRLKSGNLQNFNDTTTVVPVRNKNIGKVIEYIPRKQITEDDERWLGISKKALDLSYKSLADKYKLDYGNNYITRLIYGSPYSQVEEYSRTNKDLEKEINFYKDRHYARVQNIRNNGAKVITQEGDTIPISRVNINARGKILFADETGNSVFVNNLSKLNEGQITQLNENLSKGLYPVKVDNGRYEHYQTSNPNYNTYTALDFYRDPKSLYILGSVNSYKDGGEVEQVRNAIEQAKVATGIPNQFLDNWNSKRLSTGKFDSQLGNGLIDIQKANRDSAAIYESPTKYGKSAYLRGTPLIKSAGATTEEAELQLLEDAAQFGRSTRHRLSGNANQRGLVGTQRIKGEYNPAGNAIYAPTQDVLTHEQSHASKAVPQEQRIQEILGGSNTGSTDYLDRPTEVYSRLMELREANQLDPLKVWEKKDIKALKKTGIDYDILNRYKDEDILELFNTVADNSNYDIPMVADGGEIPPNRSNYDRTNPYTGKPLATGVAKLVGDLEDAANFTPIGDALAVKDTYQAAKEKDWLGMGLAALGLLPLVPSGLRRLKKTRKVSEALVPEVHPRLTEELINSSNKARGDMYEYLSDVATEKDRVLEQVNSHAYRSRAQQADKMFGTNYNETYDLLSDLYENKFFDLPSVVPNSGMPARAKMQARKDAVDRYFNTGKGADYDDFMLQVNPTKYENPLQLATHEMNHYTDFLISRNPNTTINNKMLNSLENSLTPAGVGDEAAYFVKGTEQKAYMNQLRAKMYDEGVIDALDYPVDTKTIEGYLNTLPDNSSIKKASKYHKNIKSYTKWFNNIPLLGVGLIGTNKYFNQYNSNNE